MASFGTGSFASPSVGFNSGFAWPESVRRPLASSNGNGSNKRSVGGDMGGSGLSSTKSAARRLPMSVIKKSAHFGDDGDGYDDDDVEDTGRGQRSGGGSNSKARRRRSGSNLDDDDDDDEDDVVDKENRNYGLVDDTPSRPSGKHRPMGGDDANGGSGVADDLVPLRFNKTAKTMANVAATSAK